jgi:hypothetical protein
MIYFSSWERLCGIASGVSCLIIVVNLASVLILMPVLILVLVLELVPVLLPDIGDQYQCGRIYIDTYLIEIGRNAFELMTQCAENMTTRRETGESSLLLFSSSYLYSCRMINLPIRLSAYLTEQECPLLVLVNSMSTRHDKIRYDMIRYY